MIYNSPNQRIEEPAVIDKTVLMKEFDFARNHMRTLLAELDTRVEIYPECITYKLSTLTTCQD
jgi:hypothetical protein